MSTAIINQLASLDLSNASKTQQKALKKPSPALLAKLEAALREHAAEFPDEEANEEVDGKKSDAELEALAKRYVGDLECEEKDEPILQET